ncbi:hypothetical protein ACLOJK_036356, partial [Asimina triloba]
MPKGSVGGQNKRPRVSTDRAALVQKGACYQCGQFCHPKFECPQRPQGQVPMQERALQQSQQQQIEQRPAWALQRELPYVIERRYSLGTTRQPVASARSSTGPMARRKRTISAVTSTSDRVEATNRSFGRPAASMAAGRATMAGRRHWDGTYSATGSGKTQASGSRSPVV